ncbi:hypothetical protein WMY93_031918, partial [Mugilogobius chulae]
FPQTCVQRGPCADALWDRLPHTSSGFPYTFHNGVAYFHSPRTAGTGLQHWTPQQQQHQQPAPVMMPQPYQPAYHQPAYQHYQPRHFQNHYQWNSVETGQCWSVQCIQFTIQSS